LNRENWQCGYRRLSFYQGIEDGVWVGELGKCVEIEKRWREERDRLAPPKEPKEKKLKEKAKGKGKGKGKKAKDEDEECESHGEESE
jgi:hypothetical protein